MEIAERDSVKFTVFLVSNIKGKMKKKKEGLEQPSVIYLYLLR